MTRYLLGVTFEGGVVDTPMEEWKPAEIQAHFEYYKALNRELRANGELTGGEILTGPTWRRSSRPKAPAPRK